MRGSHTGTESQIRAITTSDLEPVVPPLLRELSSPPGRFDFLRWDMRWKPKVGIAKKALILKGRIAEWILPNQLVSANPFLANPGGA